MSALCLICGRDHQGKILGGKVGRIKCFRLTPADRRARAKEWRKNRCPCGLIASQRHRRECSVWRMNKDGHLALDAAMRAPRLMDYE